MRLVPPRARWFRLLLVLRALRTLVLVELAARRTALPMICERFGLRFDGFTPVQQQQERLTWDISNTWWAVEAVLARWPWARDRQCLRRSLVLGHQLRDRQPSLCLEVETLDPFRAHAWLLVGGHRLDMGATGAVVGVPVWPGMAP